MIKSLTSLRGIFILFIFFHHCMTLYPGGGSMAVTFFFVLGGFSLTLGYKDRIKNTDFSYKHYLTRRCIKFYPLHWLCLIIAIPFVLSSLSWLSIPTFFANALLLQTWIPVKAFYFSFNAVSWYLADTIFFAIMFPLLCKWITRASIKGRILIASSFLAVYAIVAIFLPSDMYHAVLYISPYMRLIDFVLGIFLALVYLKIKENPAKVLKNNVLSQLIEFALILSLVIESCVLDDARCFSVVYWPLIILLIFTATLSEYACGGGRIINNSLFQRLGELSFVIFLTHQLVLRYTGVVFKLLHFENIIIYVCLTLFLTIMVSIIVNKFLLTPTTKWLTKRIQPSMIVRS